MKTRYSKTVLAGAIVVTMCAGLSPPAFAETYVRTHTFSMGDVSGGFNGSTYGPEGLVPNVTDIICTSGCDTIYQDSKSGTMMYPVDSQFGFIVEDFVGAAPKPYLDGEYLEGHVGNIYEEGAPVGLAVSNAKTDKFKVKYPQGTWCAGLGSNSVKCETEHYSVLEHVLTCNETLPYFYVENPLSFPTQQAPLIDPADGSTVGTCATGALDDTLYHIVDGFLTGTVVAPDVSDPTVPNLETNEASVLNNIAVGPDYGMTKKDDGKVLYRFGNFVKKPNDIRLYAKIPLPDEWKVPGADYTVTSAKLIVDHLITNNPNDQLRPEDMENEGAIGRKPTYTVDGSGNWLSNRLCYEGDGDEIPLGTVLKNAGAALGDPSDPAFEEPATGLPYPYSSDLVGGFTNGWYTSTDRDPFANVDSVDLYTTASTNPADPAPNAGDLANGGPRWRLKPNKFGQDLPGLEIPISACSPVPYSSANIRYPVGVYTQTTINLLDWAVPGESPLASSKGWVNAADNIQNYTLVSGTVGAGDEVFENTGDNGVSINGAPLTDDFDLLVYIKGDRKATAIYTARLEVEYEGAAPAVPDLVLVSFTAVPTVVNEGEVIRLTATVRNDHPDPVDTKLVIAAYDSVGLISPKYKEFPTLAAGETYEMVFDWTSRHNEGSTPQVIIYTAAYDLTNADDMANNTGNAVVTVNPVP